MSAASGGEGISNPSVVNKPIPDQLSSKLAWASNGASGGSLNCRSFDQIIEEEKKTRNIIEIHLSKLPTSDDQIIKNLTFDELGELLFDELKINPSDCVSLDYNTGRYDTKHVQLKPNVTADQFITPIPIRFKGHEVTVKKQLNNITRVTFRNVPLNVPNEEIIHLCKSYGQPVDYIVHREILNNDRNRGMKGSTRFVDIELNKGSSMMNYYWLEGPLPGDQGRRILVLHNGQVAQCAHCLRRAGTGGCPAGGNGKACNLLMTPRAKMSQYIQSLRSQVGYVSLKTMHMEKMAKNFPSLPGFDSDIPSSMDEDNNIEDVVPINPIEEKDKKITALEKQLEKLESKEAELASLKEAFDLKSVELEKIKINNRTSLKKLSFTKKATEERILSSIANPEGFVTDPLLIGVYSATLDEDEIKIDTENEDDENRSRKHTFLKSMENKIDFSNQVQKERFGVIKNQIIDKVKATKQSRARSRSGSLTGRSLSQSQKRDTDSVKEVTGKSPVRQKISGIPKPAV